MGHKAEKSFRFFKCWLKFLLTAEVGRKSNKGQKIKKGEALMRFPLLIYKLESIPGAQLKHPRVGQ